MGLVQPLLQGLKCLSTVYSLEIVEFKSLVALCSAYGDILSAHTAWYSTKTQGNFLTDFQTSCSAKFFLSKGISSHLNLSNPDPHLLNQIRLPAPMWIVSTALKIVSTTPCGYCLKIVSRRKVGRLQILSHFPKYRNSVVPFA